MISGVQIANVSVCTDQNPSESEGAITQSTLATSALNSSLLNQFQIFTLHLSFTGSVWSIFCNSSLI